MKKILSPLAILSVLLTINCALADVSIKHIFRVYNNKTTVMNFVQTSINSMSGQKIIKKGILKIKPKREMVFDYDQNEEIVINDFEVIDFKGDKKYIYKLDGFNKTLFLLFLGKMDIDELFFISKKGDEFVLTPKYKSNIDNVYALFKNNQIKKLTIVDIYSNKTIYQFNDSISKRTQAGD